MERQRVLTSGPIAGAVLSREGGELAGYLRVPAEGQRGLPTFLEHLEAIEAQSLDVRGHPIEVLELPEGVAAPEVQRLVKEPLRNLRILVLACPCRSGPKLGEPEVFDGIGGGRQTIAVGLRHDPCPRLLGEGGPESRDVCSQRRRRRIWTITVVPEIFGEPVDVDDRVRSDRQECE